MDLSNTTFHGGNPTWANACVGENGFPEYWEYAKGFSQAATILIDTALQRRGLEPGRDHERFLSSTRGFDRPIWV